MYFSKRMQSILQSIQDRQIPNLYKIIKLFEDAPHTLEKEQLINGVNYYKGMLDNAYMTIEEFLIVHYKEPHYTTENGYREYNIIHNR